MNNLLFKTILLKGEDGSTIKSIEKTNTVGLVDTYTITLDNGDTTTFDVTNGASIDSIELTSSDNYIDTYTVNLTDGTTTNFNVSNGQDFTVPKDSVVYYDGDDVPEGYVETDNPIPMYEFLTGTMPKQGESVSLNYPEGYNFNNTYVVEASVQTSTGAWTNGSTVYNIGTGDNPKDCLAIAIQYAIRKNSIDVICHDKNLEGKTFKLVIGKH